MNGMALLQIQWLVKAQSPERIFCPGFVLFGGSDRCGAVGSATRLAGDATADEAGGSEETAAEQKEAAGLGCLRDVGDEFGWSFVVRGVDELKGILAASTGEGEGQLAGIRLIL